MSLINTDKNKTCSFTGHRILPSFFNPSVVEDAVNAAIKDGYDCFLVGMAIGYDSLCFRVLEGIRLEKNIKIIACVPCADQAEYFNKKQKKEYERMLKSADESIVLAKKYYDGCMQARNALMVDNSSRIIAYMRYRGGGTYSTLKYAAEKGLKIVYLE